MKKLLSCVGVVVACLFPSLVYGQSEPKYPNTIVNAGGATVRDGISLSDCLNLGKTGGFPFVNYTKNRAPANSRCSLFPQRTFQDLSTAGSQDWDLYVLGVVAPSMTAPSEGKIACAVDGQTCNLSGPAWVQYGVAGNLKGSFKMNGAFTCLPASFNIPDPIPGVQKTCFISSKPVLADDGSVTACAGDGETCNLSGPAWVVYGVPGNVKGSFEMKGAFMCLPASFNIPDPIPGVRKTCFISSRPLIPPYSRPALTVGPISPTEFGNGSISFRANISTGGAATTYQFFVEPTNANPPTGFTLGSAGLGANAAPPTATSISGTVSGLTCGASYYLGVTVNNGGSNVYGITPTPFVVKCSASQVTPAYPNTIANAGGATVRDGISLSDCLNLGKIGGFPYANYTKNRAPANSRCSLFPQRTFQALSTAGSSDWDLYVTGAEREKFND